MMHYDAKGIAGWLYKLGGFDDAFVLPFLRAVVCLKDALKARDYASGGTWLLPLCERLCVCVCDHHAAQLSLSYNVIFLQANMIMRVSCSIS